MLKNKKIKYILHIFAFFLIFFVYENVSAKTVLKCIYTNGDDYKLQVTINENGKVSDYNYLTWGGKSVNEAFNTGIGSLDDKWESGYWDIIAYEKQPNTDSACPPKILGAHKSSTNYGSPTFNTSASWDNANLDATKKVLDYNASLSSFDLTMSNPRPVNSIVFKQGTTTSYNSSEAKTTDGFAASGTYTLKTDTKYLFYIKGTTNDFKEGAHFSDGEIRCEVANNSTSIKNISRVVVNKTGNYYKNIAYFTFETTTPTETNASAQIKCTFNDGATSKSSTIYVKVEGTGNSTSYTKKDVECYYKMKVAEGHYTDFKAKITNYNDGYGTYNEDNVSFVYKKSGGSEATVTNVTSEIQTCENCSKYGSLYVTLTKQQFYNAFKSANGDCPVLYTADHTNFWGTKNGNIFTTSSSGTRGERYYIKSTNSSNVSTPTYYSENTAKTCGKTLTYSKPGKNDTKTATINFIRTGTSFSYNVVGADVTSGEKSLNANISNNSPVTITLYNYTSSGNYSSHTYKTELKIDSAYLNYAYNSMASGACIFDNPKSNKQENSAPMTSTYTYNWARFESALPDEGGVSDDENDNGSVVGSTEGTGVDSAQNSTGSGNIGGFNVGSSGSTQSPDQFCNSLLGSPSSRNGVGKIVENILTLIRIGVPILLIITSMVDFTKATGKDDEMVKAKKNAITRFIVAVAVLFAPSLVNLVLGLLGWDSCAIF